MKTVIKYLSIAFFACMTMLACGNVDDPDDPYTPTPTPNPPTPTTQGKFMSMDHDIPAAASEEILTLTGLSSSISEMAGQDYFSSWLTITKEAYTSGAPKIKLIAKDAFGLCRLRGSQGHARSHHQAGRLQIRH